MTAELQDWIAALLNMGIAVRGCPKSLSLFQEFDVEERF
jgi:hypothetical protein